MTHFFSTIEEAIEDFRSGRMIVVVDDEDRENEGDLTIAAEKVTPEVINFMAKHGRGLICLAMTEERLDTLQIPLMTVDNQTNFGTAFCISIEARNKVSTGISAADRAATILTAIDPASTPQDLVKPGHIFPLRARKGGVLMRAGQTEAAVDLARIAGMQPAGVICEIMNDDGTMARVPQLQEFIRQHGLKMITVAELIKYRLRTESFVVPVAETLLPTPHGIFRMVVFECEIDHDTHVALVYGEPDTRKPVLVRVHSHCLTGDIFSSRDCQCHTELERSMEMIAQEGTGILLYMHQRGRGFELQKRGDNSSMIYHGMPNIDRDAYVMRRASRDYGTGAQILAHLNLREIRLLTNHPRRIVALEGYGIKVVEEVPIPLETPKAKDH
jgi:3,4-dihydroxy 2-butanone 4-phosphate synthase / GTP cyclohydrolase II